jgi:hypothetical protein
LGVNLIKHIWDLHAKKVQNADLRKTLNRWKITCPVQGTINPAEFFQ